MNEVKAILKMPYKIQREYFLTTYIKNGRKLNTTLEFLCKNIVLVETDDFKGFKLLNKIIADLYKGNFIVNFSCLESINFILVKKYLEALVLFDNENGTRRTREIFKTVLGNMSTFSTGDFILGSGNITKGFCFDYLFYIPKTVENNTLILEGNNSFNANTKGNIKDILYLKDSVSEDSSFFLFADLKCPILMPLIPSHDTELVDSDSFKEFYPQTLSRDVILSDEDSPFYRLDLQIIACIEDAKKVFKEKCGFTLHNKTFLYGYDVSGIFASRLAFLHPDLFCGVFAGGISGILPLPFESYNGVNLIYPTGAYDFSKLINYENQFLVDEYLMLPQKYFVGEKEEELKYNIIDNRLFHTKEVSSAFTASLGNKIIDRLETYKSLYRNLGNNNIEIVIYSKTGHDQLVALDDAKSFYLENSFRNDLEIL